MLEIEREQGAAWQITQTVTTNSFLLTGLAADTRYKFKVRSKCSVGGHSKWSQWLKFKTALSLTGPTVGSNLSEAASNLEDGQPLLAAALSVQIWPNPVQSNNTLQIQNLAAGSATIHLFDLAGRLVQTQHIQSEAGTWEGTLNLSNLPNGLYLLQVNSGGSTHTIKLVLSH